MASSVDATCEQVLKHVAGLPSTEVTAALSSRIAANQHEHWVTHALLVFFSATLHDNKDATYHLDSNYATSDSLPDFVKDAQPILEYLAGQSSAVAYRAKASDFLWAGLPSSQERIKFGVQAVGLLISSGMQHLSSGELSLGESILLRAFRVAQSVRKSSPGAPEAALNGLTKFFDEAFKRGAYLVCSHLIDEADRRGATRPFLEGLWELANTGNTAAGAHVLEALARKLQKTDALHQLVKEGLSRRLAWLRELEMSVGGLALSIQYESLADEARRAGCSEVERTALEGYQRTSNAAMEAAAYITFIPQETILPRLHTLLDRMDGAPAMELGNVFLSAADFLSFESVAVEAARMKQDNPLFCSMGFTVEHADGRRRVHCNGQELELAMNRLKLDMVKHGAVLAQFLTAARAGLDWESHNFTEDLVERAPNNGVMRELLRRALNAYFRLDFIGTLAFGIPVFEALLRAEVEGRGHPAFSTKASGVMDNTMGPLLTKLDEHPGTLGKNFIFTARVLLTDPQGPNLRNDHCHGNLASYNTHFSAYFGWLLGKFLMAQTSWTT